MQTATLFAPTTPTSHNHGNVSYGHVSSRLPPLVSSAPSTPKSSPISAAQARRRSQYKTHDVLCSPSASRTRQSTQRPSKSPSNPFLQPHSTSELSAPTEEAPRKAFLRERFKTRCLERAQKDRERRISGKRSLMSEGSSDGPDDVMDYEDEEDEDTVLNDELFRRIMASASRKRQHEYRLSYTCDVGSSFDPELEDITEWETELKEDTPVVEQPLGVVPEDLDEEELAAYAEEYDLHLEDLPLDDIFSLSDMEDNPEMEDTTRILSYDNKGKAREILPQKEDVEMNLI